MKKILFIVAVAVIAVSCGNKQQAVQNESDSVVVSTDSVAVADDKNQEMDAEVIGKIQEFYKFVFGEKEITDAVIKENCTKKLMKKLADDYDYDCEGGGCYAIWDFRSDNQDGPSNVSKVNGVDALGEGKYKVHYTDMGHKGYCIIKVIVEGDKILFDEIVENKSN